MDRLPVAVKLLVLLCLCGCFHGPQITADNEAAHSAKSRPIDIDSATAEKIGQAALQKIGYDELIRLAEKAGFVAYKSDVNVLLASYGSVVAPGFVPVFSRYALAAAVTSQADSPLPGPADLAALGVVVVGLVDAGLLDGYLLNTATGWLFSRATNDAATGPAGVAAEPAGSGSSDAAKPGNAAYEEARAGGRHSGTLKNYSGRSTEEIEKAISSYERQVEIHKQKIANPEQYAERWPQMGTQEQAGLLNKWRADAARNGELANVLRGLLQSR